MKKIYCCRWMIACARAKEDTSYCCCQSWSWPSLPRRCRRCFELPFILFYGRFFRCASHPTTHPRFICTLDIGKALDFIGLTLPFSLRPETGNLGAQDRKLPNLPPTSPTNRSRAQMGARWRINWSNPTLFAAPRNWKSWGARSRTSQPPTHFPNQPKVTPPLPFGDNTNSFGNGNFENKRPR